MAFLFEQLILLFVDSISAIITTFLQVILLLFGGSTPSA